METRSYYSVPVAVFQDPTAVSRNPVAVFQDTVAVSRNPVAVFQDPVAVSRDPVAVFQDPLAVSRDPVAVFQDTVAVSRNTVAVSRDTVTVSRDPVAGSPDTATVAARPDDATLRTRACRVAARLIESLDGEREAEVDEAWAAEIERRCADRDSGRTVGSDWEQVRQRIEREIFNR